ncbi:MAG: tetratricopeptide repeat protein [Hyphomicrobiaceae bacterium]|nr:tetratricopeptide repeat protein [Hyphomicrobiaceae bacterium]
MRKLIFLGLAFCLAPHGSVAHAGMKKDLADCPNPKSAASATACTRILASGRLPKEQHYIAYYNRAWAHRLAGRNDQALADYGRARALRPSFPKTLLSRGSLHRDMGRLERARKDFDSYIAISPKDWQGYLYRARTLRDLGRRSDALDDAERAIERAPAQTQPKILRALLVAELGDNAGGLRLIDEVLAKATDDIVARYVKAVVLHRSGQPLEALKEVEQVLQRDARFTAASTLRGRIQEERGKIGEARSAYADALNNPLKNFDAVPAQATARARLASLGAVGSGDARLARATPARGVEPAPGRTVVACRRYVPAAATTIVVACDR